MIEDANQSQTLYYVCTDHLGSITALVDVNGNIAEEFSYDAWGRRRNPTDWTFDNVPASQTITRGFTGHEHLDAFGLINMNGRIYDPVLGRFAQPDILVQAPGYTQSFNRYSYCFNNPLVYTDPSGYHNEPMYNPHGYNYNFDIAGYFDGIYWLSSANYDISGPYAGLFDPSVSNGGGSSGGAPAYNQGASMGNSDQQIKLDGYSDFEYKQYTKALTAWRKGQEGDPPGSLLAKLYWHYQVGGGSDYTINASTLDFSYTNQSQLKIADMKLFEKRCVNLFEAGINEYSLAFGKLDMIFLGDNKFAVLANPFDFNVDIPLLTKRNAGNAVGWLVNNNFFTFSPIYSTIPFFFGGSYNIVFRGLVTIPK